MQYNFRDPRWGRGGETYGEDPYLTSVFLFLLNELFIFFILFLKY
jgi:hypothetical protein